MKYEHCWKGFTLVLFVLICINLVFLSLEVIYRGLIASGEHNATFEIDVCYRPFISGTHCHSLEHHTVLSPKKRFICEFVDRLGCYTKDFEQKNVSEIISKFQRCNIIDLVQVESETKKVTKISTGVLLFNGFICAKHTFHVHQKEEKSQFKISTTVKNQPFEVYVGYSRSYASDGKFKAKRTHLFERECWVEEDLGGRWNDSLKCTETNKEIVVEIEYYSAKYLKRPFSTDCVYRKNSNQNDCYEGCVKKQINHDLLTYNETENLRWIMVEHPKSRQSWRTVRIHAIGRTAIR